MPARADDDALLGREGAEAGDRELAGDDHHRDPGGEPVQVDEADQRCDDEQLVGERIHELAEVGDLVAAAGDVAVEPVGRGGKREDHRGDHVAVVDFERSATTTTGTARIRSSVSVLGRLSGITESRA